MKHILAVVLLLLLFRTTRAQTVAKDTFAPVVSSPKSFILPIAVAALASSPLVFPKLQWSSSRFIGSSLQPEDVGEWVPLAALLGMRACGLSSKHNFLDLGLLSATAFVSSASSVYMVKRLTKEERPFGPEGFSFPSGHSAFAFMGAELIRLQYGERSAWYGVGAYAIAASVAVLRVHHGVHFAHDVVVGAAMGVLSARIAHWLYPYLKKGVLLMPIFQRRGLAFAVQIRW